MPLPTNKPLSPPRAAQRNPTMDKVGIQARLAGSTSWSVILREFSGRLVVDLAENESLASITVKSTVDAEFGHVLAWQYLPGLSPDSGRRAWAFAPYAEAFGSGRNYIEVVTDRGVTKRQVWVGTGGGLYINNFDATTVCPILFCDKAGESSLGAEDISFSMNILPYTNDEFFRQQEHAGNRWCNTLKNMGGAVTAQVFIGELEVIPETDVLNIHGYYWVNPRVGYHHVTARLRPEWGSRFYKDLIGAVHVRNLPCPEVNA